MVNHKSVKRQIVEAVRSVPGCLLEDVVMNCPDRRWNEIFVEVGRLSRTGELLVTSADHGSYLLDLPKRLERTACAANGAKDRRAAAAPTPNGAERR